MRNAPGASDSYDVVVAGGGPAGAALAAFIARAGYCCLILERAKFPRYHIGESLIPHTYGTLDRLGLLPRLRASDFPQKHSVRFVSPTGRVSSPFYFSDRIQGEGAQTWQVERSQFDRMMLDHAREQGVEVREETRVEEVLFDGDRAVGLRAVVEGARAYEVCARIVVDASGGATLIGRQLGLRRNVPGLVKASIWTYYRGGVRLEGIDAGETTIFHIGEGGWFWYIPQPDDLVSVGIVAAPEYLFAQTEEKEPIFLGEVERCAPLRERLARAEHVGPVRCYRQLAYANRQTAGAGWQMVGDARAFLDPQFSFGVFVEYFPGQRGALIDCLTGDVLDKDMSCFLAALAQMTPPPEPL